MAVPKSKISKRRGRTRYANWTVDAPGLVECGQCHELIKSHQVCPNCGYYDGKQVVTKKEKKQD